MTQRTRADLQSGRHVAPGYYLVDGDDGDPAGRVLAGPFLPTPEGRDRATEHANRLMKRMSRPPILVVVADLSEG